MTAIPKQVRFTEAEYLAIERAAEFKSEYYDGEIFAMAGASYLHNVVKDSEGPPDFWAGYYVPDTIGTYPAAPFPTASERAH